MGSTENKIGVDGVFIVEEGKQEGISKIRERVNHLLK